MVLTDTSVWVDHLRIGNNKVEFLLEHGLVLIHPFVTGELACGNLKNRKQFLADLTLLPSAMLATHDEVLYLIEQQKLWGKGLGWADIHLLASARLSGCKLWTLDLRLAKSANDLGVSYL